MSYASGLQAGLAVGQSLGQGLNGVAKGYVNRQISDALRADYSNIEETGETPFADASNIAKAQPTEQPAAAPAEQSFDQLSTMDLKGPAPVAPADQSFDQISTMAPATGGLKMRAPLAPTPQAEAPAPMDSQKIAATTRRRQNPMADALRYEKAAEIAGKYGMLDESNAYMNASKAAYKTGMIAMAGNAYMALQRGDTKPYEQLMSSEYVPDGLQYRNLTKGEGDTWTYEMIGAEGKPVKESTTTDDLYLPLMSVANRPELIDKMWELRQQAKATAAENMFKLKLEDRKDARDQARFDSQERIAQARIDAMLEAIGLRAGLGGRSGAGGSRGSGGAGGATDTKALSQELTDLGGQDFTADQRNTYINFRKNYPDADMTQMSNVVAAISQGAPTTIGFGPDGRPARQIQYGEQRLDIQRGLADPVKEIKKRYANDVDAQDQALAAYAQEFKGQVSNRVMQLENMTPERAEALVQRVLTAAPKDQARYVAMLKKEKNLDLAPILKYLEPDVQSRLYAAQRGPSGPTAGETRKELFTGSAAERQAAGLRYGQQQQAGAAARAALEEEQRRARAQQIIQEARAGGLSLMGTK